MNEDYMLGYRLGWSIAFTLGLTACSSNDQEPAPNGSAGGSTNGGATGSGPSAGGQPMASIGGSSNSNGANDDGSGGTSGSGQTVDVGGSGGAASGSGGSGGSETGFSNTGLCAFAGTGVWEDGSYSGTHDLILVGDQGVGEDLCVVRFDSNTISDPEVPCVVTSSGMEQPCSFGTIVELSNPTIVTDVEGVCGNSERALDEDGIAARVGEQFGMGFAPESTGHGNILVRLDENTMTWTEWSGATFEPETGDLEYRQSDGVCDY